MLAGLSVSSLATTSLGIDRAEYLTEVMTQWAQLLVALALLGAGLLAWYQVERSSKEIRLSEDMSEDMDPAEIEGRELTIASAIGHVRRTRIAPDAHRGRVHGGARPGDRSGCDRPSELGLLRSQPEHGEPRRAVIPPGRDRHRGRRGRDPGSRLHRHRSDGL